MFLRDKFHTSNQEINTKGITEPRIKWDNQENQISLSTVAGDFQGNVVGDSLEGLNFLVYVVSNITSNYVQIVEPVTGEQTWVIDVEDLNQTTVGDRIAASPAVADFDKDGKTDIAFITDNDLTDTGTLYVFEPIIEFHNSSFSWDVNNTINERIMEYSHQGDTLEASITLSDFNNDGREDIAAIMGLELVVFDVYGDSLIFEYDKALGNMASAPVIYAMSNGDSRCVFTTLDGDDLNIYMVTHQGDTAWNHTIELSSVPNLPVSLLPSPSVGEISLTQEGKEIVILSPFESGNGNMRIFSKTGDEIWQTPTTVTGQFDASPCLADIDGDSLMEIGVVSWRSVGIPLHLETNLYLIDDTGDIIWRIIENESLPSDPSIISPSFCLINQDQIPDLTFMTSRRVIAVDCVSGNRMWEISSPGNRITSSPAIGDFDRDDFLDITTNGFTVSNAIIDLTVNAEDITIDSNVIYDGVETPVSVMVRNLGKHAADSVSVYLYENTTSMDNVTLGSIPGDDSREVELDWIPTGPGLKDITVFIDFNDTIQETDEENNKASLFLDIEQALPDVVIRKVDLIRADKVIVDNNNTHIIEDESSLINITVENMGLKDLDICPVLIKINDDDIFNGNINNITTGQEHYFEVIHSFDDGNFILNISLDNQNDIMEFNDSNNYYNNEINVLDNDASGRSYLVEGFTYNGDFQEIPDVKVELINPITLEKIWDYSDNEGYYSLNLANLSLGYVEGQEIIITARYQNEGYESVIYPYSEDGGILKNILLVKKTGPFDIIISGNNTREVNSGSNMTFIFQVVNEAEEEIQVSLIVNGLVNINTNEDLNWFYELSMDSISLDIGESDELSLLISVPKDTFLDVRAQIEILISHSSTSYNRSEFFYVIPIHPDFDILQEEQDISAEKISDNEYGGELNFTLKNNGHSEEDYQLKVNYSAENIHSVFPELVSVEGQFARKITVMISTDDLGNFPLYINITVRSQKTGLSKHLLCSIVYGESVLSISNNDVTFSPVRPQLNKQFSIRCKIFNNGTADSKGFPVVLYDDVNGSRILLSTENVSNLIAGSYVLISFSLTLDEYGLYSFFIEADPDNIVQGNHINKVIKKDLDLRPDIVIYSMSLVPFKGNSNNLSEVNSKMTPYLKVNLGNPTTVDLVQDIDILIKMSDQNLSIRDVHVGLYIISEEIGAGENSTIYILIDLTGFSDSEGDLLLSLAIDINGNVTEIDETNNDYKQKVKIGRTGTDTASLEYKLKDDDILIAVGFIVLFVVILLIIRRTKERKGKKSGSKKVKLSSESSEMKTSKISRSKVKTDIIAKPRDEIAGTEIVIEANEVQDVKNHAKVDHTIGDISMSKSKNHDIYGQDNLDLFDEFSDMLDVDFDYDDLSSNQYEISHAESQGDFINNLRNEIKKMKY